MGGWVVWLCWGQGRTLPLKTFGTRQEAQAYADRDSACWPAEGWKRAPWAIRATFRVEEGRPIWPGQTGVAPHPAREG